MSEFVGRFIEAGVASESSRGVAEATAEKWVKNVNTDVILNVEKVIDDNTRGRLEDSEKTRKVKEWYQGDLSGILHADAIGYFFYNVYGTVNSEVYNGAYKHTFSVLNGIEHPTFTYFAKDGVEQLALAGGIVNTLAVEATVDDYVRFTANIIAKSGTANTGSISYDNEYDFIGRDIEIKMADKEADLATATAIKAKSISISYDMGAINNFTFGSYNPDNLFQSKSSIEGTISLDYADDTFKELFNSDDAKYLQIAITGEAEIGTTHPTMTFLFNKVMITSWTRSSGADELSTQEVGFKAFYNADDSEQSSLEIINTTQTYVATS